MTRATGGSLQPEYFESMYANDPDPWRFATSDYERAKYEHTLQSLDRGRYGSAFEVGCSIGVLTGQLALRCDNLLSVDVSETALAQARRANTEAASVTLRRMQVPAEWPADEFDLIVLSEVLYYLTLEDIDLVAKQTLASLRPDATVVLVHYTDPTNYPTTGDAAAERFMQSCQPRLMPDLQERRSQYRLDRLRLR